MVELLSPQRAARLRSLPLSYGEVGMSAADGAPGYRLLERSLSLDAADFPRAAERLMTWRVHEAAGLRVKASSDRVEAGAVVELVAGPRWLPVRAPCRVVDVIDEPDRLGFSYGTLPGHPESGEESFVVERRDGAARFTVRAVSRPSWLLAQLGGPITTLVQSRITDRYLNAIARGG